MIPAGKYFAHATGGQLATTNGGKEQMAVGLEIQRGPQTGQSLTWYGYFTPLAMDRTMESLRYLGWTGTDLADLEGLGTNTVEIVVEHDTYNDRTSAKVQWINQVGGGVAVKNAMDDSKARAFAEKMRARAAQVPQSLAEQSEPPPFDEADPGPDSPPPDDDEIPF